MSSPKRLSYNSTEEDYLKKEGFSEINLLLYFLNIKDFRRTRIKWISGRIPSKSWFK